MPLPAISIIVPVRNELPHVIANLPALAQLPDVTEVIAVDSSDLPVSKQALLDAQTDNRLHLLESAIAGRAVQMHLGASHAKGEVLWFVHADTRISEPEQVMKSLSEALASGKEWGCFDVCFDNNSLKMRIVAQAMNVRSKFSGICTGDQAIFVTRELYDAVGGFPPIPIMEDIALSKRLKSYQRPARVHTAVITSARRWETNGYVRTVVNMWTLRLLYWLKISPERLSRMYR